MTVRYRNTHKLPHRWERMEDRRGFECVTIPIGGVETGTRCKGCRTFVGDKQLHECFKGNPLPTLGLGPFLDLIAEPGLYR